MARLKITAFSEVEEGDLDENGEVTEETYENFMSIPLADLEEVVIKVDGA